MKHEFNIQQNPRDSLFPIRVLRCQGDELLGKFSCADADELRLKVGQFRRTYPKGIVQVECPDTCEVRPFRDSDCAWLFDHPATFKSSL